LLCVAGEDQDSNEKLGQAHFVGTVQVGLQSCKPDSHSYSTAARLASMSRCAAAGTNGPPAMRSRSWSIAADLAAM
jgi:hypothetical protein